MLLQILDKITCPICKDESRRWEIEGDMTELRIVDGTVTCPNNHVWQVREEVLRFDKENSDEEMQLLDYDKTGFPLTTLVGELERADFLAKLNEYITTMELFPDELLKVTGSSILFFKYLEENSSKILVVYPDEGILRQIQVIVSRKQIYNNMAFVRSDDVDLVADGRSIYLFQDPNNLSLKSNDIALVLDQSDKGINLWNGELASLKELRG
ncbi:MAG: hypothetical protein ACW98K_00170 [Candidatus Kariarchaeaceae archaeon]|jgi:hypothetical protein